MKVMMSMCVGKCCHNL